MSTSNTARDRLDRLTTEAAALAPILTPAERARMLLEVERVTPRHVKSVEDEADVSFELKGLEAVHRAAANHLEASVVVERRS